jgi:hypothetical protein
VATHLFRAELDRDVGAANASAMTARYDSLRLPRVIWVSRAWRPVAGTIEASYTQFAS